jgi:hypothetical protein
MGESDVFVTSTSTRRVIDRRPFQTLAEFYASQHAETEDECREVNLTISEAGVCLSQQWSSSLSGFPTSTPVHPVVILPSLLPTGAIEIALIPFLKTVRASSNSCPVQHSFLHLPLWPCTPLRAGEMEVRGQAPQPCGGSNKRGILRITGKAAGARATWRSGPGAGKTQGKRGLYAV